MTQVKVTAMGPQEFNVTVRGEDTETSHKVRVPSALLEDLGLPEVDEETVVKESFNPEYLAELRRRLS